MCDGGFSAATMFAVSSAMSVATATASIVGQTQAAHAQKQQAQAQAESIKRATINNYDQLQLQREQERQNATEKAAQVAQQGIQARSSALTAAGEAGVSGLSVEALLGDLQRQELEYTGAVQTNYKRRSAQIDAEMNGVQTTGQSQINSIPVPRNIDFVSPILNSAFKITGAYQDYAKQTDKNPRTIQP